MKTGFISARLLIVVIVLALMLGTPQPATTDALPTVAVWPAAATCASGQMVVRIENVTDLYAYDVFLEFTPGIINVTSVQNGGFLEFGFTAPAQNQDGMLSFGMTQTRPATPKSGSGSLIIVQYDIVQPGQLVNFHIGAETDLVGEDFFSIAFQPVDGTLITATCPPQHTVFLPLIRR